MGKKRKLSKAEELEEHEKYIEFLKKRLNSKNYKANSTDVRRIFDSHRI